MRNIPITETLDSTYRIELSDGEHIDVDLKPMYESELERHVFEAMASSGLDGRSNSSGHSPGCAALSKFFRCWPQYVHIAEIADENDELTTFNVDIAGFKVIVNREPFDDTGRIRAAAILIKPNATCRVNDWKPLKYPG